MPIIETAPSAGLVLDCMNLGSESQTWEYSQGDLTCYWTYHHARDDDVFLSPLICTTQKEQIAHNNDNELSMSHQVWYVLHNICRYGGF